MFGKVCMNHMTQCLIKIMLTFITIRNITCDIQCRFVEVVIGIQATSNVWYNERKKYHTVRTIPKSKWQIVQTVGKSISPNIQIYDISIPLHGTDTQIIGGGVKHVLYAYTFPLRKNINEKLFHTFSIIRIKKKVKLITCFYSNK